MGLAAPARQLTAGLNVPSPLPSRILTLLVVELVTARSAMPSPLKSPTATALGPPPTGKLTGVWKVPSPLPSATVTVLGPVRPPGRTISALPSPLKSPTTTEVGAAGAILTGGPGEKPTPPKGFTVWAVEIGRAHV